MPHLRKIIYYTAVKYGGQIEWEILWRKYKECKNAAEREKIISALGATRDKNVLKRWEVQNPHYSFIPSFIHSCMLSCTYLLRTELGKPDLRMTMIMTMMVIILSNLIREISQK